MKKIQWLLGGFVLAMASTTNANDVVTVKVKGMVCSFCATGIKKKVSSEPGVAKVDVNLDEKRVTIDLKEGQKISDERVKALITDAGYSVESISVARATASVPAPAAKK